MRAPHALIFAALIAATAVAGAQSQEGFRFKSGVDLVNVTATVTDEDGRFVSGLRREDFTVYEDGKLQDVSHFSNDRVPVSLGIVLDTSGSMSPEKMSAARSAIDRLIYDLLDKDDELFLVEFATRVRLRQDWTTDRGLISRAVRETNATGGTAIYDAISTAIPTAQAGTHVKKALLLISDGNDTNSATSVGALRQQIRESEVLVYALGIDGSGRRADIVRPPVQIPLPMPFPFPGGRRPRPGLPPIGGGGGGGGWPSAPGERVNADALRQITDDTGGRTEIVRGSEGLGPATARIADELSKQYYLGYSSNTERDGQWHSIRVNVRDRRLTVRARKGYVAS
ncbi:MAG TPA: VWA domain-containing protein [Vicinamibacterales bacterium]|jgi:VWFA-related protein|nr:VWA domain-containing protein [Vicinamibacterales bacterium]